RRIKKQGASQVERLTVESGLRRATRPTLRRTAWACGSWVNEESNHAGRFRSTSSVAVWSSGNLTEPKYQNVLRCFHSLRQGNELIVARDRRQASRAPIRFRRFNPFLRRGDKIPPDNSRAVQLGSTDENEVRSDSCGQDNFGLRREDHERAWNEVLIAD